MKNKRFLNKLIPPIAISLALIGLIFVIIFWYILRGTLFNATEKDFLEHAQIYSIIIEEHVDKLQTTALQVASRTQIRKQLDLYLEEEQTLNTTQAFILPKLQDAINASSDVSGIQWMDLKGNFIVSLGTTVQPVYFDELVSELKNETVFFEAPVLINNKSYIRLTTPINNLNNEHIGYNIVYFPTVKLEQLVYRKLNKDTRLDLFTRNEDIQIIIEFNSIPVNYPSILEYVQKMDLNSLSSSGTFVEVDNQALAVVPVIGTPWFVKNSEPLIDIYDAILAMLYPVLSLVFILVGIAIFTSWRIIVTSMHEVNSYQEQLEVSNKSLSLSLTELKNTQEQLIRRETLAALGELVGGLMHELNTPIGNAITSLSFLDKEVKSMVDPTHEDVSTYQEAYSITQSNLKKATSNIETFRILNMDQATLEMRRININDYIHEIIHSLKPKLKHTHHQVIVGCDPDLYVATTPGILSQILTNLIINAITHGFETIPVGHIHIDVTKEGSTLTVLFQDDGLGIPAENLDHIFQPYFTTKRHKGGTGLGLHIVYSLVTTHLDGTISIHSEVGKGTQFEIQFPVG